MDTDNLLTDLHDRLCYLIKNRNWEQLIINLQPKKFVQSESENIKRQVVAKLADTLTRSELNLPFNIKIIIMKCLTNVSISRHDTKNAVNYIHKAIDMSKLNPEFKLNYHNKIYEALSMHNVNELDDKLLMEHLMKYPNKNFPYDGLIQWIIDQLNVINNSSDINSDQWDLMRICFSFLCNISVVIDQDLPESIYDSQLKKIIVKLFALNFDTPQKTTLLHRACCFVYNIMKITNEYFILDDLVDVIHGLLKVDQLKINIAQDILLLIMNTPEFINNTYGLLPDELKLYLLEVFYQNLKNTVYHCVNDDNVYVPSNDIVKFLAHHFKLKSDLILKTVESYVNNVEPVEITIILDILGVLTTTEHPDYIILQDDLSLLINAVYLLRALHMAGKESDNCFTPVQKLSEIVPNTQNTTDDSTANKDIQSHPAFGFKAALIRLIGNLVFSNKKNQDTVRDIDGIPLLLDCTNIDARNPLIVQWTILAIRNLCEGNKKNQELIASSQKIKYVDSEIIQEFGIKLNENEGGTAVGIVPLSRINNKS